MSVDLTNSQELNQITIPFQHATSIPLGMSFDSVTLGTRTADFESISFLQWDQASHKYTVRLTADAGGGTPPLPAGSGEILRIFFSLDPFALGGNTNAVDSTNGTHSVQLATTTFSYNPIFYAGQISSITVQRGDANYDLGINVADITYLVAYLFQSGPAPVSIQAGDVNRNFLISVEDLTYLVAYLFDDGPAPPIP
jgi:hypothetical protein